MCFSKGNKEFTLENLFSSKLFSSTFIRFSMSFRTSVYFVLKSHYYYYYYSKWHVYRPKPYQTLLQMEVGLFAMHLHLRALFKTVASNTNVHLPKQNPACCTSVPNIIMQQNAKCQIV